MTLFHSKTDWSTVHLTLLRFDILQLFQKFSPDTVPMQNIEKVKKVLKETRGIKPEDLILESSAAANVSEWVHAVIKYRDLLASVQKSIHIDSKR